MHPAWGRSRFVGRAAPIGSAANGQPTPCASRLGLVPTASGAAGVSKVYLDTPYVLVRWEAQGQWVLAEWKGSGTTPQFRAAQEMTLVAIHENDALRFLADTRKAMPVLGEDRRWLEASMIPRFAVSGVRWLATVLPLDQLVRASLANVSKTPPSSILRRADFGTLEEAKTWLSVVGAEG